MRTLRQTLRSLGRTPSFALTVIATLGIGIGLNVAIFTVVDCILLRPLGYHDAERIVSIRTHMTDENRSFAAVGGGDYSDLVRQVRGLEAAAYYAYGADGIKLNGSSMYVPIASVSPRFAEVMGVQPVAGRLFHAADATGTDALVSAGFAQEHFSNPADAVGQTITYAGAVYNIAGVLPKGFSFPAQTEVWVEVSAQPLNQNRTAYNQHAIGKRRRDVSEHQLAAELDTFSAQLQKSFPEDHNKALETVELKEQVVGSLRPTLKLLMAAVLVVLLIVCANVTHLQLVRATRQMREITIRTALGATRSSLAARALGETLLLASAGALTALLLAVPALRLLARIAPPDAPRLADVRLNFDVLLFSVTLSFIVLAATALLPLWHTWHIDPASALRQDSARGTESRASIRLRSGFIVAEVALTLALSVAAILLTRQLMAQSKTDLGFKPDHLLTLDAHAVLTTPAPQVEGQSVAAQAEAEARWKAIDEANLNRLHATLETTAAVPGVESVAAVGGAPMGFGGSDVSYAVKGRQEFAPGVLNLPDANIRPVTPEFLSTMRIPLRSGRNLAAEDRGDAPPVLLINQELARRVFPGQDPLGQQIMCGYEKLSTWWTIVGVVGDIREDAPADAAYPTMYVPVAQHPGRAPDMQILVRTRNEPGAMVETLRRILSKAHPDVAIKATTMEQNIRSTQLADHFRTILFGSFAAVSLLLAAVGMYGVTAYSVSQRRFEFGLRIALGADRAQVLTLVLAKALGMAVAGVAVGVLLSLSLVRVVASVVGKLPAFDAAAYGLAAAVVMAISALATLMPARSAATVDPMAVLRSE